MSSLSVQKEDVEEINEVNVVVRSLELKFQVSQVSTIWIRESRQSFDRFRIRNRNRPIERRIVRIREIEFREVSCHPG